MSRSSDNADERHDVTEYLIRASRGDKDAADRAYALLYEQFRKRASVLLKYPNAVYGPTDLVHEAYTKLIRRAADPAKVSLENRHHFMNYAAKVMLHVIASPSNRPKQEALLPEHDRSTSMDGVEFREAVLKCLQPSLQKLRNYHPRAGDIVAYRWLSVEGNQPTLKETADHFGVSVGSVRNDLDLALSFLRIEIERGADTLDERSPTESEIA